MTNVLYVKSSLFGEHGQSTQLADALIEKIAGSANITTQDLATNPPPHMDMATFTAAITPTNDRSAEQNALAARADAYIAELQNADVLVLAVPMYNFGIPSTLKAWIDHVSRAGATFQYTATGPEGLLSTRKAIIIAARGGAYQGTPADTQTPYLQTFLGFLGIKDVEFIYAEGLNMGDETKDNALQAARNAVANLSI